MKQNWAAKKLLCFAGIMNLLACLMLGACGDEPQSIGAINTAINTAESSTIRAAPSLALATTSTPNISAPPSPTPDIQPTARNKTMQNWLKGIPCKAPCWENITPGKTTSEEALKLLKNNQALSNPRILDPNYGTKPVAIYWDTNYAPYSPQTSAFMSYHSQPTPTYIEIMKPLVAPYKLKDVFSTYGEPSHVIAVNGFQEGIQPITYNTYIIYLSQGLILANNSIEIPTFTLDATYNEVYFFIPGQQGLNLVDRQEDLRVDTMVEWQGVKDFKFYCRRGSASKGIRNCS